MTTHATIASSARITTAPVTSGIGSLSGIAAQLSLPNIACSTDPTCRVRRQPRPRPRRDLLSCDLAKQFGVAQPIAGLVRFDRLSRELGVAVAIQDAIAARRVRSPVGKCERRHDV